MRLRFYIDPQTGEPHIYNHNVTEAEIYEAFENSDDDFAARNNTRSLFAQTKSGRWLRIVYTEDENTGTIMIITAYPPHNKALRALRRRLKKHK